MRIPRPWFREQTGCYYVQFGKRQINLGSVAKTAKKKYEKLLRQHGFSEPEKDVSVRELVTLFLEWSKEEHEPDTTDWYGRFLDDFVDQYGRLLVSQLKPYMVNNWCCRETWTQSTRRCGIVCVKRAVSWGISEGYISDDPLKTLKKPPVKSRKRVLSPDERKALLDAAKEPFRTFLWALFESGARPGEVARVTAADFHGDVWVFEKHKTAKRTGRDRVVYLTPELSELCKKLAAERPEGSLFRNQYGLAWSRNAIRIRFRNLRRKLKLQGVVAYTARHSFCTDGPERGVPIATMAELLGHSSTRMISQHYNHLAERKEHLKRAAMQARGVVAGNGSSE